MDYYMESATYRTLFTSCFNVVKNKFSRAFLQAFFDWLPYFSLAFHWLYIISSQKNLWATHSLIPLSSSSKNNFSDQNIQVLLTMCQINHLC